MRDLTHQDLLMMKLRSAWRHLCYHRNESGDKTREIYWEKRFRIAKRKAKRYNTIRGPK